MGGSPWTSLIFVILSIFTNIGFNCRVELCSRQYMHAINKDNVPRGPTYFYCTILESYSNCIKATAKACRGNLDYHSVSTLVHQWNLQYNCSNIITQGPSHGPSNWLYYSQCRYRGSKILTYCGFFGDPHLRTIYNELQTCKVKGAWPLINNPFLAVQVTNVPVSTRSHATAIEKITVIVKSNGTCATEKTFEAQKDNLPGVFIDGSTGLEYGVFIKQIAIGSHIEIHLEHIETLIVLRLVEQFLTFAIKMPLDVAISGHNTIELCVNGCPAHEQIDPQQIRAMELLHAEGLLEAIRRCQQIDVTDFYFDACVFDLVTTGDPLFSHVAQLARRDMIQLAPNSTALQQAAQFRPSRMLNSNSTANSICISYLFNILCIILLVVNL